MASREEQIKALEKDWAENPRWKGIKRNYSAADVVRLRGSLQIEYTLAKRGAEKLWELVNGKAKKGYVNAFGAITAGQAMQQAKAGLEAVYLSGWQVAADGNTSETMYPDQSLYAYDSVPTMVRRINNTFKRADEIQWGVLAEKNGWAGIIVNGCIRDSEEINACNIGVRALAAHPQRSVRKGVGDRDLRVSIAGVAVNPGDWIYADADGVLVSNQALI